MMETAETGFRTLEEVKRIFGHAKLDSTELSPGVQCLNFSTDLDNDAVCLMEMDSSVVGHICEGQSVVVRGSKTDSAVLCTDDKTFEIREAETSNILLLLPHCDVKAEELQEEFHLIHRQVCAMKQQYYELRAIKPRLKKMRTLLEENMYSGPECERDEFHQGAKYSFDDLLEQVQASESEILSGLSELQACQIDGYWRLLEFDFVDKVLCHMLNLREEQDWSLDAISAKVCCEELEEIFPRSVVVHILRSMSDLAEGERLSIDPSPAEKLSYRLSEDKICRFFAELLLRPVDKFNLKDFLDTWQKAVPVGMTTSLYQLEGLALVERDTKPEVIRHYSVLDLPEDPAERFTKLFTTKQKWTMDEISPFVKDLCTDKIGVSGFLLKFARASTQSGIKVYSSRKALS